MGIEEGPKLEFKAAASLEDPFVLGREIVGMLNHQGGELWIGLQEEEGHAVRIDPVARSEQERDRLRDFLVDSIEPVPEDREVQITVIDAGDGRHVLRIDIDSTPGKKPYALLRRGGRHYLLRTGSRLRMLTREELAGRFVQARGGAGVQATKVSEVERELLRERDKRRGHESALWMAIWPVRRLDLDLSDDESYERLLMEPELSQNRRDCFLNFANPYQRPQPGIDKLSQGGLTLHRNGRITADLGTRQLMSPLTRMSDQPMQEIHPLALLEYVASILRLARAVYRAYMSPDATRSSGGGAYGALGGEGQVLEDQVLGDLALFGINQGEWTLRPGSPGNLGDLILFLREEEEKQFGRPEDPDIVAPEPIIFHVGEVIESPDRCAYRLLTRIYEGFGYRSSHIAQEYDRAAGRVSFLPPLDQEAAEGTRQH